VTQYSRRRAEPVAATSAKLDQELARQLTDLAAEDRYGTAGGGLLSPALGEAAVWVLAALGAWVVVAFLA
jgi:hypothetical protein